MPPATPFRKLPDPPLLLGKGLDDLPKGDEDGGAGGGPPKDLDEPLLKPPPLEPLLEPPNERPPELDLASTRLARPVSIARVITKLVITIRFIFIFSANIVCLHYRSDQL